MSSIAKTQDDGLQVLEQLLPNFHPSVNVSIEIIDETHEERTLCVQLDNVNYSDDYENDYTQRRTIIWTLNFTVKTYLFGPVDLQKDIRKVTVDYRTNVVQRSAELRYTSEVQSTENPPVPRDEVVEAEGNYTAVNNYEDIYATDQEFFGL